MKRLTFLLCLVASLSGCATLATAAPPQPVRVVSSSVVSGPASPVPATPVAQNAIVLTYSRSGGLVGRTTVYTLYRDGSVRVGAPALVRDQTQRGDVVQLPGGADAAAQLLLAIDASGIAALAPGDYAPPNACCDRYSYELTLYVNGQPQSYQTVDAANHPASLAAALELVQQYLEPLAP